MPIVLVPTSAVAAKGLIYLFLTNFMLAMFLWAYVKIPFLNSIVTGILWLVLVTVFTVTMVRTAWGASKQPDGTRPPISAINDFVHEILMIEAGGMMALLFGSNGARILREGGTEDLQFCLIATVFCVLMVIYGVYAFRKRVKRKKADVAADAPIVPA